MRIFEIYDKPFTLGDNPDDRTVLRSVEIGQPQTRRKYPHFNHPFLEIDLTGIDLIGKPVHIKTFRQNRDVPNEYRRQAENLKHDIEIGNDTKFRLDGGPHLDEDWKKTAAALGMAAGIGLSSGYFIGNKDGQDAANSPATYELGDTTNNADPLPEPITSMPKKQNLTYPKELEGLEGKKLKDAFIALMKPKIDAANAKIRHERKKMTEIFQKGKGASVEEQDWIRSMMVKYRANEPHELITKIHIIPAGLAIAQAATESRWGTSRLAKEGNALFGQKSFKKDASLRSQTDGYAGFETFDDSVESYMRNLNSHPAYEEFRKKREALLKKGKPSVGELVHTLTGYSVKGKEYIKYLLKIVRANDLDKLV